MGSIGRRLEELEARAQAAKPYKTPRYLERYFHALDNARRELEGLEPLPDLEYTEEDRRDDLRMLDEHVPALREDAGWQSEEATTFLDSWERDLKEKLQSYRQR